MADNSINWGKLREQNRVKEIGIPWTPEEDYARLKLGVPADSIRRGCLTMEAHNALIGKDKEEFEKTGKVYLRYLPKEKLLRLCAKYKIPATEEATNPVLIQALFDAGAPKKISVSEI